MAVWNDLTTQEGESENCPSESGHSEAVVDLFWFFPDRGQAASPTVSFHPDIQPVQYSKKQIFRGKASKRACRQAKNCG